MNHSYHHSSIAGQVLLLLCCATILLSACSGIETAQVVPTAGPGTVYPPTLTPKPHIQENNSNNDAATGARLPTATVLYVPSSCVVSGQKTYARPDLGFCLSFPARFVQKDANSGQPPILGPALDQSTPPLAAGLEVRVVPAKEANINKEVDAYLAKVAGDKSKIRRAPYTLGNETALLVDGIPGSKYGSRDLFAVHNGMFFHVIITPSDISNPVAQTDVEELLQTTIASFTYTK